MRKRSMAEKLSLQSWYYNNLCGHVHLEKEGRLFLHPQSVLIFDSNSCLELQAPLDVNDNAIRRNGRSTIIHLADGAVMRVTAPCQIYYGGDVLVRQGGSLTLGKCFFNSNVLIRCSCKISVGNHVFVSHNVTIMDSDAHQLEYEGYQSSAPIVIEDDVWIGTRVTILKGVTIGKGSVIGAGAVVTRDIPQACVAAGVPARIIRSNISWK